MLSPKTKIAVSGLLAAAAVASGVGAASASAATETVTVTIQVTHNSLKHRYASVVYLVSGERVRCAGAMNPTPKIEVAVPKGASIYLYSTLGCYSGGLGGTALVEADATKAVQVSL